MMIGSLSSVSDCISKQGGKTLIFVARDQYCNKFHLQKVVLMNTRLDETKQATELADRS